MLLNYWSFWNFNHFLSSYVYNFTPYTSMLDLSVCTTSILGGFMTYVYPKKLIYKNYVIKKWKLWTLDILFHQLPLLYMLYLQKPKTRNVSAVGLIIPASMYLLFLNVLKVDKDKLYGIRFINLIKSSGLIMIGFFGFPFSYKVYKKIN